MTGNPLRAGPAAAGAVEAPPPGLAPEGAVEPLSPREMECLRMAAHGMTDNRAARVLGISHNTVRFHLHNACLKLGAPNRCAAIYRAAKDNRI